MCEVRERSAAPTSNQASLIATRPCGHATPMLTMPWTIREISDATATRAQHCLSHPRLVGPSRRLSHSQSHDGVSVSCLRLSTRHKISCAAVEKLICTAGPALSLVGL